MPSLVFLFPCMMVRGRFPLFHLLFLFLSSGKTLSLAPPPPCNFYLRFLFCCRRVRFLFFLRKPEQNSFLLTQSGFPWMAVSLLFSNCLSYVSPDCNVCGNPNFSLLLPGRFFRRFHFSINSITVPCFLIFYQQLKNQDHGHVHLPPLFFFSPGSYFFLLHDLRLTAVTGISLISRKQDTQLSPTLSCIQFH